MLSNVRPNNGLMAAWLPRMVSFGGRLCHVTHLLVKASGRISEESGRFLINSGTPSLAMLLPAKKNIGGKREEKKGVSPSHPSS